MKDPARSRRFRAVHRFVRWLQKGRCPIATVDVPCPMGCVPYVPESEGL